MKLLRIINIAIGVVFCMYFLYLEVTNPDITSNRIIIDHINEFSIGLAIMFVLSVIDIIRMWQVLEKPKAFYFGGNYDYKC